MGRGGSEDTVNLLIAEVVEQFDISWNLDGTECQAHATLGNIIVVRISSSPSPSNPGSKAHQTAVLLGPSTSPSIDKLPFATEKQSVLGNVVGDVEIWPAIAIEIVP